MGVAHAVVLSEAVELLAERAPGLRMKVLEEGEEEKAGKGGMLEAKARESTPAETYSLEL